MPTSDHYSLQNDREADKRYPPIPQFNTRELLRDPLAFFPTLARQYGDIVCYRRTPEPAYLVNHPDYIRHILKDNNRNYSKATYINQMFKSVVADGLLTAEGEDWLQQRRLMQPAFHHKRIANLDVIITAEVSKMLDRWRNSSNTGQPIDIAREMAELTLNVTTRALFGVDIGEEVSLVGDAVLVSADLLEKPRNPRFQNASRAVDKVVYRIIDERRRSNEDTGDLLSILMQVRDEESGIGMTDLQLRNQVLTLLLAGYETTSSALTWTWFLLSSHPGVLERLRRELAENIGERTPANQDTPKLKYTRMIFEEALRLYPPAWILGRKALADDEIGGYTIPANAVIAISPYAVHRHPGFWEDPEAFIPERFTIEQSAKRHRFAYIPFGAGPRQCIGNNLAMLEAQLIIAMVARAFTLHLVPGQDIKPEPIFILRPNQKILMTLQ
jgi:cytochrome P450